MPRAGRVLSVSGDSAVIELLRRHRRPGRSTTAASVLGRPLHFGVGEELLGRVFDGLGRPRDGLPPPLPSKSARSKAPRSTPVRREDPRDVLETGISSIDGLNTLVLGQKLPIFSESGLSHDALALR